MTPTPEFAMKLIQTECPPNQWSHSTPEPLDEYYTKKLEEAGVDVAAYWYRSGSYEGSGEIVFRTKDGWRHHSMGHCSCYGPMDSFMSDKPKTTLAELKASFTKGLDDDVAPVFKALARYT